MDNNTEKFDKGKNAVLVENNAQTIFDHLNELEKNSKSYSKRWFWELLQNAKDSVDNNSKVSVKVILEENKLSFLHTGDAFEETDILHLIFHGSSKKSLEGKTGRFGTGFMSTHLLSRKVNITGTLADETFFKFDLNREANSVSQQQENLENSYRLFCNSNRPENYTNGDYATIFSYELSQASLTIAKEGIEQLQQILPFVMAFNQKIDMIEVNANQRKVSIKRGKKDDILFSDTNIARQEVFYDEKIYDVVYADSADSNVAVLLEKEDEELRLVNLNESYPKLFFDFPLFGTERFGIPAVINSTKFDLKGERDGIYLGAEDKDKPTIKENKRIIDSSINCISILIKFLSEKEVLELYNLFKFESPFEYTWLHKEWLEGLYVTQINVLLDTECTKSKGLSLKLKDIVIPYSETIEAQDIFKIVTDILSFATRQFSEVSEWVEVAKGFSKLEKKELVDYSFIINENKLCRIIEDKKTLSEINRKLIGNEDGIDDHTAALKWLNYFFYLLSKEQFEYLISHHSIIPNQKKRLVKKELVTPYIDNINDENIKGVIEQFGWEIKSDLIYPGIVIKEGVLQSFTLEKALTYISSASSKITDDELLDPKIRRALLSNLKWLIDNRKEALLKEAFVIVEKGRETSELSFSKRRLYQTSADKLLAPSIQWLDKYSIYKDIVLKRFLLIDEYAKLLTKEDFDYLQSEDLIFTYPLLFKKYPSKNDLKLLVKVPESYSKLLNEKEEVVSNDIEYSDIAYLTRSDDSILSKTADSIKSAKALLKFLFSQILDEDIFFNQISEVYVNGEIIKINKCLWASRLRDTQWVPVKSADGEKQSSEKPSVSNITELIRDEEEILRVIKSKNAALLFNQLGLSVADIIRNTLTNEDDKLKWDMTFSQLITNGNISPDLAVEMLEDPHLQKIYQEKKEKRERIKTNQKIGYLFEEIFRKIFQSDAYKDEGFIIKRKPVGSDFGLKYTNEQERVIDEQDILNDKEEEILFEIGQVLIELKATGKNIAELTPTQAEVASNNIENYVLAVLPLSGYDVNENTVKANTRFVVNIAQPLKERFAEYQSYASTKAISTKDQKDIKLDIEDGNIRYQVKSAVWENTDTKSFDDFINWMKIPGVSTKPILIP